MALIACTDCAREVSDKAPACPQCGAPIADRGVTRAIGTPLTTTQSTSKALKMQSLLATLTLITGFCVMFATPEANAIGGLLVLAGLIWLIVTRVRIWWHHS